jgi:hypothetical protein
MDFFQPQPQLPPSPSESHSTDIYKDQSVAGARNPRATTSAAAEQPSGNNSGSDLISGRSSRSLNNANHLKAMGMHAIGIGEGVDGPMSGPGMVMSAGSGSLLSSGSFGTNHGGISNDQAGSISGQVPDEQKSPLPITARLLNQDQVYGHLGSTFSSGPTPLHCTMLPPRGSRDAPHPETTQVNASINATPKSASAQGGSMNSNNLNNTSAESTSTNSNSVGSMAFDLNLNMNISNIFEAPLNDTNKHSSESAASGPNVSIAATSVDAMCLASLSW